MTTKVSILFDGGFFTKKFEEKNKKFPTAADVQAEVTSIMAEMAKRTNGETKDIVFRVYYYDCKPFTVWTSQGRQFLHDTLARQGISPEKPK